MAFVTMGPMLKRAQAARYGIAAFNMIDYNSARSIVEGAAELDAPIIVQVSVKTIRHWGTSRSPHGCACLPTTSLCR